MRVLVAEDDVSIRGLLAEILRQDGHEVILTADGEEAWAEYRQAAPDVVIADWMMPGSDGLELCRRIRTDPANPYTYIVVVTGKTAPADALAAMKAGADDHLPKPFTIESLEAQMVAASRLTHLHQELAEQSAELQVLGERIPALKDGQRPAMLAELEALNDRARRYGHRYWLAIAEVDRIARYREYHGTGAGDRVMDQVAACLADQSRRGDSLHRLGDSQFLLILPEQDDRSIQRAVARLRQTVENLGLPHLHNPPKRVVTLSMGVALFDKTTPGDITHTLYAASELAVAARQAGGDVAMTGRSEARRQ